MKYMNENTLWYHLAKKTFKYPMFEKPVVGISLFNQHYIAQTSKRFFYAIWIIPLGAILTYIAISKNLYVIGNIILFAIGILMLYAAVRSVASVNKVFWNPFGDTLHIRCGNFLFHKQIALFQKEITPILYRCPDDKTIGPGNLKDQYILTLRKQSDDETEIRIATSDSREELVPSFESLKKYIGIQRTDDALEKITLPNGKIITASVQPLHCINSDLAGAKLSFRFNNTAKYKIVSSRIITSWFLLLMIVAGSLLLSWLVKLSLAGQIFLFLLALPFIILAIHDILFCIRPPAIIADKIHKSISFKSSIFPFRKSTVASSNINFDQIATLQICGKVEPEKQSKFLHTFELNLILNDKPDHRINITSNHDKSQIYQDAQKFADFLNVPLIDHTE